jgi:riboflavin biosynthesis pyrimidine reductase
VIVIDDDPAVTVRRTEPEAISNLRIVLERMASPGVV